MKLKNVKIPERKLEILNILQKEKFPIIDYEIRDRLSEETSQKELEKCLNCLREEGYDIQTILIEGKRARSLVRFGVGERYYRPLGTLRFPALFSGDWHIGNKGFSEMGLNKLIKDIEEYDIKSLVLLGDIIQGLGVYRSELQDLQMYTIDEQVQKAVDYLKEIPRKTNIHLSIGGHEQSLKGSHMIGFDASYAIGKEVKNCTYYGENINLEFQNKYRFLGFHSRGGLSYSSSYRLERIWGNLVEKPEILAIGHHHRLFHILKPPKHLLMEVGTLTRESSYVYWRGITAQVGWYIIEDYEPEKIRLIARRPKIW